MKNFICAEIWLEILQYQINEMYYMAETAKIVSSITLESNGLRLMVGGLIFFETLKIKTFLIYFFN